MLKAIQVSVSIIDSNFKMTKINISITSGDNTFIFLSKITDYIN